MPTRRRAPGAITTRLGSYHPLVSNEKTIELTIGHSPDPDDAFMWWPLGSVEPGSESEPTIDTGPFRFRPIAADIDVLNRRAMQQADLDITACSMHAYPHIRHNYALTTCGSSMGDNYGPKVVAREPHPIEWLLEPGITIGIPGEKTTAFLTLRLLLESDFDYRVLPFETITDRVLSGDLDAGLVIHEAQITYTDMGLHAIADLGEWWGRRTGLPLPLGANAIRRDLDRRFAPGTARALVSVLRRSIEHAMGVGSSRGIDHALGFAQPGTRRDQAEKFIGMYVNALTIDCSGRGTEAIRRLLREGYAAGLCPDPGEVDIIGPDGPA